MTLIEIIKSFPQASTEAEIGNWENVAAILNSLKRQVIDNTLRSSRWLMTYLSDIVDPNTGATEADIVLGTLQAANLPRVKAAYNTLCADGIDLSNDQVQSMLPLLAQAANWPEGLVEKITRVGVREESVVNTTASECQSAWEDEVARLEDIRINALRFVKIQSIQKIDAEAIIGTGALPTLDEALVAIKASLIAFGAWN